MSKKKVVSLLLSVFLVFSMITPAFAAELTDVKDTKYQSAVERLAGLGILTGYEDGTFKADKTITRAEFAAVAIRSLGLDETGKSSKGNTVFSDVNSTHWASGYVNLATSKGIIKGYPDGTFKPEKEVTYAEAVTMLVRVLGYEPAIKGTNWPANYLVKAAEIGVTSNVPFDQSAPANRGDIALMVNNSLEIDLMEQDSYGDETIYKEQKGQTLLSEYLNVHELEEAMITQTAGYSQDELDADEVEVSFDSDTYIFKIKEGVDLDKLLGHEVTLFVKDVDDDLVVEDDEVVLFAESTTNKKDIIAWDYIVGMDNDGSFKFTTASADVTITLDETDDTFEVSEDATIYYNHEKVTDLTNMASDEIGVGYATLGEVAGTVILDDNDDIIFMNMFNYDDPVVITEVDVDDEKVKYFKYTESESSLKLDGETYTIYKNGELASLEDLAADDVLYIWELSDGYAMQAFDGKITGELEAVNADSNMYWDYSLVVDGKTIYAGPNFTLSLDENDTIDLLGTLTAEVDADRLSDLEDMVGTEVTVYLGKYQDATDGWNYGRHIVNGVDTHEETFFMVTEAPWHVKTSGDQYYIKLVNKDDQEVVYEFTEDETEFNGDELDLSAVVPATADAKFQVDLNSDSINTYLEYVISILGEDILVDVEFNSDGEISAIDTITANANGNVPVANVNDDYDRIKVGANWYYVTEDTAIFDATNNEAISWESFEDIADIPGLNDFDILAASVDDKELEAIVVDHGLVGVSIGSSDYGLVFKRSVTSSGLYVTLAVDGVIGEYYAGDLSSSDQAALKEGTLIKFTADGDELDSVTVESKYGLTVSAPGTIAELNKAYITADDGTITETVTKHVYDANTTYLYIDVDSDGAFSAADDKVGTWNAANETFTAEIGYTVEFSFAKFEIVSGGVDTKNGVLEVVVFGLDEDADPTYFIDFDQFGEDSYVYDVDVSHLADPSKKVLKLEDLNDGDIINVYDVDGNGIYDYIVVVDR